MGRAGHVTTPRARPPPPRHVVSGRHVLRSGRKRERAGSGVAVCFFLEKHEPLFSFFSFRISPSRSCTPSLPLPPPQKDAQKNASVVPLVPPDHGDRGVETTRWCKLALRKHGFSPRGGRGGRRGRGQGERAGEGGRDPTAPAATRPPWGRDVAGLGFRNVGNPFHGAEFCILNCWRHSRRVLTGLGVLRKQSWESSARVHTHTHAPLHTAHQLSWLRKGEACAPAAEPAGAEVAAHAINK